MPDVCGYQKSSFTTTYLEPMVIQSVMWQGKTPKQNLKLRQRRKKSDQVKKKKLKFAELKLKFSLYKTRG